MITNSKSFSLIAIFVVFISALIIRFNYFTNNTVNGYNATSWDALGYYMYQPGFIIYDDVKELKWLPKIDSTYHVTGGWLYQANKVDNGNYVFKYLGGVAILQLPFFYIGHSLAYFVDQPQDGFSWPYQYCILFGAICWFLIGILFLRSVLLNFFSELITCLTILLLFFASNLPQYICIDGAMSHSYIFPLYCIILWLTYKWHIQPSIVLATCIGFICGLATITRPTELIMIFIPLFWSTQSKEDAKLKWQKVRLNKIHVYAALIAGFIGLLPQLLYWKYTTGTFVYDVGSKWYFLNPWFRVLFGFYNGWFIYTPLAILFIVGLWYMKGKDFGKSVWIFCLLNIYIVISWSDWKYGASYSTRALVQSYPVFALPLASFMSQHFMGKKRYVILLISIILIFINIYQIRTYNTGVLNNFSLIEHFFK